MLDKLKNLHSVSVNDVEDGIALVAFGDLVARTYAEFEIEPPEWLRENLVQLRKDVRDRTRDILAKELKETNLALERLRTADERRADLRAKAERLTARLGGA